MRQSRSIAYFVLVLMAMGIPGLSSPIHAVDTLTVGSQDGGPGQTGVPVTVVATNDETFQAFSLAATVGTIILIATCRLVESCRARKT